MLDTFNEYHCSFLECSALISYKTINMGHTEQINERETFIWRTDK